MLDFKLEVSLNSNTCLADLLIEEFQITQIVFWKTKILEYKQFMTQM